MNPPLPRKIWIFWEQGLSGAPVVVTKCIDSWRRLNPTWEIILLDSGNLHEYIELEVPEDLLAKLSRAHRSDLIRLALLAKYGGVWADATTYCMRALDEWIDECCTSGFFVFHKPRRDLLISNWFIASAQGNALVRKLYKGLSDYWIQCGFSAPNLPQKAIRKVCDLFLNRNISTTQYWFSPVITKLFRVYPYFVFHYMFAGLVANDGEFKTIWGKTRKVDAGGPHLIQHTGMFVYPEDSIKRKIEGAGAPLFKLKWQYARDEYRPDTVLYYLLEQRENNP